MLRLEVGSRDPLHARHPPRFDESQDGSEHRGFRVFVPPGRLAYKNIFFSWFWCQGYAGLVKWKRLRRIDIESYLFLVESTNEAFWSWTFIFCN